MIDDNQHIINLIAAYISKEINENEFQELTDWLNESSENEKLFSEYLLLYKKSRRLNFIKKVDQEVAWKLINSKIKKQSSSKKLAIKLSSHVFKYAAIAILFIGITYLYQNDFFNKSNEIIISTDSITLQLENGNVQIINEDGATEIVDKNGNIVGSQSGHQLIYSNTVKEKALVYNTLNIPYGKRFEIKLSDGTMVHLNSGSSLKYPIKFIEGMDRCVFLSGEAYFSVTKDAKHPFIVNAKDLNVKVYGTKFNVSAYSEDTLTDVVLVEGSVGMYANNETSNKGTILIPGTKGSFNRVNQNISSENVDTLIYTSWMDGGLFFRKMTFKNIAKKLERHYNKKIIISNKQLENEIFNANFKDEPIENVLGYLKESFSINYTIENDTIYIN
ncbi:FecR family protein [Thalassobellus suaedae]|uniref:FecR family protein n=1 Tax=Thalassobellus suaedae TaxID=3074124 RepID=A0ABY9XZY8_9FLAO|nr:FecR family protein [Flavobacteriaceae bacterium HL-DH10]